jgi:methionine-rich copper-binding protein CopC
MKFMRLLITTAVFLSITGAASAHEELVEFSPTEGQVVQAGLIDISLLFSDDLISLSGGSGNEIIITEVETGNLINNGCTEVNGANAKTKVDLDIPGEYNVAWRVVSGDGHPISGSQRFLVENENGYQAQAGYQYLDCSNAITQDQLVTEAPSQPSYWLLWFSISAIASGLFFFLRPKRK